MRAHWKLVKTTRAETSSWTSELQSEPDVCDFAPARSRIMTVSGFSLYDYLAISQFLTLVPSQICVSFISSSSPKNIQMWAMTTLLRKQVKSTVRPTRCDTDVLFNMHDMDCDYLTVVVVFDVIILVQKLNASDI